jgi:hypothetical protein
MSLHQLILLQALVSANDVLPEPNELIAGYRQNFARFRTLEVQWSQTKEFKEAWKKAQEKSAEIMEGLASDPTAPEKTRSQRLEYAKQIRRNVTMIKNPQGFVQDFWTDRERFQVRIPPDDRADRQAQKINFPTEALTKESLNEVYKDFYILSYQPDSAFRMWSGKHTKKGYHGTAVYSVNPNVNELHNFPPLGEVKKEWGTLLHPFDELFAKPLNQMRVTGTEQVDGKRTYLLEVSQELPAGAFLTREEVMKYKGRLKGYSVTKAWIDPSQGYLPLRIAYSSAYTYNGKKIESKQPPLPLIDHVTVEKVTGGYYPSNGTIYTHAIDPAHNNGSYNPPKEREKQIRGEPYYVPPSVVTTETKWQVLSVKANMPIQKEMFDLSFPDRSIYVDERELKVKVTGSPQGLIDEILGGEATAPTSETGSRGFYARWAAVAAASFLLAFAGAIFLFRRHRLKGD